MDVRNDKHHGMEMADRKSITIRGVTQVGAFDEAEIFMVTVKGALLLKGEGLHITQLNLDDGILAAEGYINSVQYLEESSAQTLRQKGKGFLGRLLK